MIHTLFCPSCLLIWLKRLVYTLFRRRYYFALPESAMMVVSSLPPSGIEGMVRATNPLGGWSFWKDEMRMRWVALCYNRPSSGGFENALWEQVKP